MHDLSILATLVVYKLVLLAIGFWATRRNRDSSDFFLGGRGLGPWVAALSAAASSSSAWTLMGVSGAAFTYGLGAIWILPACLGGFALNWWVVAGPLRSLSRRTGTVTVTELLAHGSTGRARRALVVSASVITLACLGGYVASQFQAAGKTFADTFDMGFGEAVAIGGAVVLVYTMLGGFWAVSVTDTLQGLVMAVASVAVPIVGILDVGGVAPLIEGLRESDAVLLDPFRGLAPVAALGLVVGMLGIGLGYPGQPHVVNRFMALKEERSLHVGRTVSMVWAFVTYSGMLVAGWCARVLLEEGIGDDEVALTRMTTELFPPILAGVILAAILSAIMSTADSQLLVCGSTVAYDLAGHSKTGPAALRKDRATVVLLSAAAIVAAIFIDESIFNMVLFAWSGLGAAFGPLLLVRILRGPVRPGAALVSMWAGFVVTIVWFYVPALKSAIYELVPAFTAALVPAWLGSQDAGPK